MFVKLVYYHYTITTVPYQNRLRFSITNSEFLNQTESDYPPLHIAYVPVQRPPRNAIDRDKQGRLLFVIGSTAARVSYKTGGGAPRHVVGTLQGDLSQPVDGTVWPRTLQQ